MGNNKLFFGENGILSAKLGTSDVKIYLGKDLMYEPSTIIVAKFVKNKGDGATIISGGKPTAYFEEIVIDGVEQQKIASAYTFDTYGEHTIEYTLLTPHVISDYSFSKCAKMTSIRIPNDVTSIGQYALQGCGFTSIDIPSSVTSIGDSAFESCSSLSSCTIGSGVTSIGDGAFLACTNLTSIDIPDSVTSIGDNAFNGCNSLTSVTVNAVTPPRLGKTTFANNARGRLIYVHSSSVNAYKIAWSEYASDIVAIK